MREHYFAVPTHPAVHVLGHLPAAVVQLLPDGLLHFDRELRLSVHISAALGPEPVLRHPAAADGILSAHRHALLQRNYLNATGVRRYRAACENWAGLRVIQRPDGSLRPVHHLQGQQLLLPLEETEGPDSDKPEPD